MTSPTAHAATLVTPEATPITQALLANWTANDQAPMPDATITMEPSSAACGFAAAGCSLGYDSTGYQTYAGTRGAFYFEMGHIFDWSMLTNADRRLLAHKWGHPHWRWWDREPLDYNASIQFAPSGYAVEDGLEAMFATIYARCAWGQRTTDHFYGIMVPTGLGFALPSATTGSFDTCSFVQWVAARDALGSY